MGEVFERERSSLEERFNGRIADLLRTHHFRSSEDLEQSLHRYVTLYNHHLPQKALDHVSPIEAMKRVAAALGSVRVLAEAGLLKGKKYAFSADPLKTTETRKRPEPRFVDAIYSGPGVVQDGKIITSGGCPATEKNMGLQNRTVELTQTFIAAIRPK